MLTWAACCYWPAAEAWRDLVPRCRALRETLTSLRELSHFTREVMPERAGWVFLFSCSISSSA